MGVEDADPAIRQKQEDSEAAENTGLMIREPEKTCYQMLIAIGDSLSNIASSDDGEDGEYEDDEQTEQRQLSEDDKPGWVMDTFTKTVQQRRERLWQKQTKVDELTHVGW